VSSLLPRLRSGVARAAVRLRSDLGTRNGRLLTAGFVAALLAPLLLTTYGVEVLTQLLIVVLVVGSWIFIAGYFGIFTFAHAALYGVGAYAAVILAGELGAPPVVTIAAGGVAAALFSLPIAYPVLRLSGAYVAMVTLAYAEIIHFAAIHFRDLTGGPTGYTGFPMLFDGNRLALYYFVFATVFALTLVMYGLLVNRFGLVARAIRESSDAAQMLGNDVPRYKLAGFIVGSSIAGVAGAMQAYTILIMSPPVMELNQMIEFMAMGIIGGLRTLSGGVFGAIVVYGLSELLRGVGQLRLVIWGFLLIVIILYFPDGLAESSVDLRERLSRLFDR